MSSPDPSDSYRGTRTLRNAYELTGFAVIAILVSVSIIALAPSRAGASWLLPSANASGSATLPLVHDSSMLLLQAATNADPDPVKNDSLVAMTGGEALIAQAGPDGTAADISPATTDGQISLYVVRSGDTLSEIATMFGVSQNTILWANNITNPSLIKPGTTLLILPVSGIQHTVRKGETLASIAKKYHADANDIALYNGLNDSHVLKAGSKIIIPGGELAAAPVPAASAVRGTSSKRIREPYLGGSGPAYPDYYRAPVLGGIITQGLHGWNAVDIGAPVGTPIHAAAAGTVLIARNNSGWNGGYGNYVVIKHGNGTETLYAHMKHPAVSSGQMVAQGQIIGYVGMTGWTTGPHVHFEIRGAKNYFAATCRVGESVSLFSCN